MFEKKPSVEPGPKEQPRNDFSGDLEAELIIYRYQVRRLVEAAERRFINNWKRGKRGWATMTQAEVHDRLEEEVSEYMDEWGSIVMAGEGGDVLNFVAFGLESGGARR